MDEYIMHRRRRVGLRAKVHQRPLRVPDVDVEVVDTDDDVDGLGVVDPPGGRGGERVQLLAPPPPLDLGFGDHLRVELGERGEEAGVADEALALLRVGADGSDQTLETRGVRRGHGEWDRGAAAARAPNGFDGPPAGFAQTRSRGGPT